MPDKYKDNWTSQQGDYNRTESRAYNAMRRRSMTDVQIGGGFTEPSQPKGKTSSDAWHAGLNARAKAFRLQSDAKKAAIAAARKPSPKKAGKPVTTERTGNPSDPKDWTNAPGTKEWAEQLRKANGGK